MGKQELVKRFGRLFPGQVRYKRSCRLASQNYRGRRETNKTTALGNERFRSLTSAYFRGAHGVLLVYDVGNAKSFSSVAEWHRQVEQFGSPEVSRVMVANRCHQEMQEVSQVAGEEMARELGCKFFEVSAQTGQNVSEVFHTIAVDIKLRLAAHPSRKFGDDGSISLTEYNPKSTDVSGGRCCV